MPNARMRTVAWRLVIATLVTSGCHANDVGNVHEPQPSVPVVYPTGGRTLTGLAATDLVRDGHRDLITVARGDGSVRVLPGQAAGAFEAALTFMPGADPI